MTDRRVVVATAASCSILAAVAWGLSLGGSHAHRPQGPAPSTGSRQAPDFGRVSHLYGGGRTVPLAKLTRLDRSMFEGGPAPARVTLVGTLGQASFFRLERADGSTCFALGTTTVGGLFDLGMNCPSYPGQQLLSPSNPIILLTAEAAHSPTVRFERLTAVSGFAVDAIAAVTVLGRDGRAYSTPVVRNTFFGTDLPLHGAVEIRATDASNRVVWREPLPRYYWNDGSGEHG